MPLTGLDSGSAQTLAAQIAALPPQDAVTAFEILQRRFGIAFLRLVIAAMGTNASQSGITTPWTVFLNAGNAQATATKAAVAGTRHVCRSISASLKTAGTAQTSIALVLRDGLTGAGNVLWQQQFEVAINSQFNLAVGGLDIPGTIGNAMTIEFAAAPAAAVNNTVGMAGFDQAS